MCFVDAFVVVAVVVVGGGGAGGAGDGTGAGVAECCWFLIHTISGDRRRVTPYPPLPKRYFSNLKQNGLLQK